MSRILLVLCMTAMWVEGASTMQQLDMTHSFNEGSLYWPGPQGGFLLEILENDTASGGNWYQGDRYSSGSHVGTHIDAPSHFALGKWDVSDIPVSNLVGPAVMVDIRHKILSSVDVNLTVGDLTDWEAAHGTIPARAIVVMCSGWSDRYPNRSAVFGNDRDDTSDFHYPGFDMSAAKWLVDNRDIVGIAVDTPSLDYAPSTTFATHVEVNTHNVYGLENVKDVCLLPPVGATLYCLPSKTDNASGAPTRILATWDTETANAAPRQTQNVLANLLIMAAFVFWMK